MTWTPIDSTEVDLNSPLNTSLFSKVRGGINANAVFNTLTALKAIDDGQWSDGDKAQTLGGSARDDGNAQTWFWDASSSAAGDDINVVEVDSAPGTGRFIRIKATAFPVHVRDATGRTWPDPGPTTMQWDTEIYDDGAAFASNTFTAPVTGKYHFSMCRSVGAAATSEWIIRCVTSNRNYERRYSHDVVAHEQGVMMSFDADMEASDTAYFEAEFLAGTTTSLTTQADADYNWLTIHFIGP